MTAPTLLASVAVDLALTLLKDKLARSELPPEKVGTALSVVGLVVQDLLDGRAELTGDTRLILQARLDQGLRAVGLEGGV
ncbi:hypothetical protein DAETH_04590 [Deinococcus aetherius]|uniref:Uncharacterized protein n=1 Tax=Deinococcus aetherius TaxID=200252 RepID=A0ABN6RAX5_9DEIO|nr:hypothetical protein [Deinococcus aetherius]BDP40490.1 hypothetical protein DAETH_04590 [Deinococcus aetherius]